MPVLAVYMIPPGLSTCLPRGWLPASVGSQTETTSSCVSARRECLGNVERERIIAAAMRAQLVPVEDDGRIPIDGPEVQQPALALLRRGKLEGPSVPDPLVGLDGLHHSGEGGFDRERDQDPTVKRRWTVAILGADGIIPQAIEIDPFRPDHLGSGIFRVRFPGINLRRPACG